MNGMESEVDVSPSSHNPTKLIVFAVVLLLLMVVATAFFFQRPESNPDTGTPVNKYDDAGIDFSGVLPGVWDIPALASDPDLVIAQDHFVQHNYIESYSALESIPTSTLSADVAPALSVLKAYTARLAGQPQIALGYVKTVLGADTTKTTTKTQTDATTLLAALMVTEPNQAGVAEVFADLSGPLANLQPIATDQPTPFDVGVARVLSHGAGLETDDVNPVPELLLVRTLLINQYSINTIMKEACLQLADFTQAGCGGVDVAQALPPQYVEQYQFINQTAGAALAQTTAVLDELKDTKRYDTYVESRVLMAEVAARSIYFGVGTPTEATAALQWAIDLAHRANRPDLEVRSRLLLAQLLLTTTPVRTNEVRSKVTDLLAPLRMLDEATPQPQQITIVAANAYDQLLVGETAAHSDLVRLVVGPVRYNEAYEDFVDDIVGINVAQPVVVKYLQ